MEQRSSANYVSWGDDSRSPALSTAAVSLGSWFPSLGQRSSSCAPPPPSPPLVLPPDTADVVGPPWRGPWPHLALITARQSSFISSIHFAERYTYSLRGDVWHILNSPIPALRGDLYGEQNSRYRLLKFCFACIQRTKPDLLYLQWP